MKYRLEYKSRALNWKLRLKWQKAKEKYCIVNKNILANICCSNIGQQSYYKSKKIPRKENLNPYWIVIQMMNTEFSSRKSRQQQKAQQNQPLSLDDVLTKPQTPDFLKVIANFNHFSEIEAIFLLEC